MNRGCARLFLIVALLAGGDVVLAQARTQKIAGDIVKVDGLKLEVEPADRSLLVPGAHVVVYAAPQPDGTLAAERLTVGKNGFVPPPL